MWLIEITKVRHTKPLFPQTLLLIRADKGFCVTFPDSDQQKVASRLLQGYHDRNVSLNLAYENLDSC